MRFEKQEETTWKNKLIWGDNKYVLASLLKDPSIAGKIKLIYIDPPFFTGTNMNINIKIGDKGEVTKEPSAIEEVAYRNMWKEGPSSFLQYMYERIKLMRDLLAEVVSDMNSNMVFLAPLMAGIIVGLGNMITIINTFTS